jgi:hypothetical protein
MLLRLQQGPARKQELLAAVYRLAGDEAYGRTTGQALQRRFEEDKLRLQRYLQVKIHYSRADKGYVIEWRERPLLNLPGPDIETLAFLADTFQPDSPHAPEVHQLIDRLVDWLPDDCLMVLGWFLVIV